MNLLVLGGGGREHAICHRLSRSPRTKRLFVLPGNAGTARIATNIPGDPSDIELALAVARREAIDLTVVGPEDPLAAGVVDAFQQNGRRIFGPTRAGAQLEADKAFAKQIMRQYAVPTADARVFTDYNLAQQFIATRDESLVVKASGLARGKGVIVCDDPAHGLLVAEDMLIKKRYGAAGEKIVVEERLEGREVSLLTVIDGRTACVLEPAQDYKRLGENDTGPNTGGMGSLCPSDAIDPPTMRQIETQIIVPMLDALVREEIPFRGVLYIGLMLTPAGPKVLEFNTRFGDPETQALLMRLDTDLLELIEAAVDARLDQVALRWKPQPSLCVVMASAGYPDRAETGKLITGLPQEDEEDLVVFHAGTRPADKRVFTSGGRVLGVTALGRDLAAARARAYAAVTDIKFDGAQYRRDLGLPFAPPPLIPPPR